MIFLFVQDACVPLHSWDHLEAEFQDSQTGLISSHHLIIISLNREGRWSTTDDFTTSFLHFSLFSTALWDLANSKPVHFLILSSYLFFRLPCLLPPFTMP